MNFINPESKIVAKFSSDSGIDEKHFIGETELEKVPGVIRWISVYIFVTMATGIALISKIVAQEDIGEPSWHKWLKLKVTN